MASQARVLPSGEKTGVVSVAVCPAVSLRGAAWRSMGAFLAARVPGGKDDTLAVRREGELLGAAERLRRRVGLHAAHQVHGLPARRGHYENMRPPAVLPGVPVPVQQLVVQPAAGLELGPLVEPVPGFLRRREVRVHLHRDRQLRAVRRQAEGADIEWQLHR